MKSKYKTTKIVKRAPRKTQAKNKTIEQIAGQHIAYWQKQLGLSHWRTRYRIVDKVEQIDNAIGSNLINPNYELCSIEILHPDHIPEEADERISKDIEVTIVHELLHARFVYALKQKTKRKEQWHIEMAIESSAKAMVAARRGISVEELK